MRVEILSIGTELLLGEVIDTNSGWLAGRLADAGYDVYWSQRVGDNLARVVAALRQALERSDIVVTSGGLGSTDDDLTRDAVAAVVGETQFIDDVLEERLRDWYARSNVPFQDTINRQAARIPSAVPLDNQVGTAPGWLVRMLAPTGGEKFIVTLPGPPRELQAMWTEEAAPRLPPPGSFLLRRTFKTCGVSEAGIFELLRELTTSQNPSVATYAERDGVHVRVAAQATSKSCAESMAAPVLKRVRDVLGTYVWGEDDETLVGRIAESLRQRGQWMSSIESITGGRIATEITAVGGVSDVYRGGLVAYDPAVKQQIGVPKETILLHGVVSEETAVAMAEACARFMRSDYAIATTGVAGPEPLEGKPPGTVYVAVHAPHGTQARLLTYASRSRAQIQERTTFAALSVLWRALRDL